MATDHSDAVARACRSIGVPPAAGEIVMEGLGFALSMLPHRRHVTAEEFLGGVACWSVEAFGLLADRVLAENHVGTARGVGMLVMALSESGAIEKHDRDTLESFSRCERFLRSSVDIGYRRLRDHWVKQWQS